MHTLKRKTGLGLRTRNREKERVKSLKSNRNCYVRELVLAFEITSKTVDAVGRVIDDAVRALYGTSSEFSITFSARTRIFQVPGSKCINGNFTAPQKLTNATEKFSFR